MVYILRWILMFMNLIAAILVFILSILLISWGADKVIDVIKETSEKFKLSAVSIAFFVMGIDLEEAIASWSAAAANLPEIALGNVIGNSIISITFCFALPALFFTIVFHKISAKYFFFLILLGIINIGVLMWPSLWIFWAVLILVIYFFYIVWNFRAMNNHSSVIISDETNEEHANNAEANNKGDKESEKNINWREIIIAIVGFATLFLGSRMLVESVQSLLIMTNISEAFFGVGIIAASTNVEEYFLLFKSIKKKRVEIGIAGLLGKIMWNLGLNAGISIIILGLTNSSFAVFDFSLKVLLNGLFLSIILLPLLAYVGIKQKKLSWKGGIVFLLGFIIYLGFLFLS
ncbi:MAG: hypothetical protein DRO88_05520 [Promethearchaeia archaeon]|nr:MAG: hypothetical protein DRO88_05520 [Candidatus Lokiarchaeia archaeon]